MAVFFPWTSASRDGGKKELEWSDERRKSRKTTATTGSQTAAAETPKGAEAAAIRQRVPAMAESTQRLRSETMMTAGLPVETAEGAAEGMLITTICLAPRARLTPFKFAVHRGDRSTMIGTGPSAGLLREGRTITSLRAATHTTTAGKRSGLDTTTATSAIGGEIVEQGVLGESQDTEGVIPGSRLPFVLYWRALMPHVRRPHVVSLHLEIPQELCDQFHSPSAHLYATAVIEPVLVGIPKRSVQNFYCPTALWCGYK
jgi:hypothetical protein